MRIDKFVREYQRIILGTIVALVALSLVVTFVPADVAAGGGTEEVAGSYTYRTGPSDPGEVIQIKRRDFNKIWVVADPLIFLRAMLYDANPRLFCGKIFYHRSLIRDPRNPFRDPLVQATIGAQIFGRTPVDFENIEDRIEDSLRHRVTWETIIMLEHARRMRVQVPDEELRSLIRQIYENWAISREAQEGWSRERYIEWVRGFFGVPPSHFEQALGHSLMIGKYLQLLTQTEFGSYRELYENQLKNSVKIRVQSATLDPRSPEISFHLKPVQIEEVGKFYRANRERMKSPPRAQVLYVGASYEKFKSRAGAVDEKTLKTHYENNKDRFKEGPEDGRRQLTFDEARARVEEHWLRGKLETDLYSLTWTLRNEISEEINALMDRKRKEKKDYVLTAPDALALVEEVVKKRNARNEPFVYDITDSFSQQDVVEMKKHSAIGTESKVERFAFESSAAVGNLYDSVDKTEKGCFTYLLYRKIDARDLPLTRRLEEQIRTQLRNEQLSGLARDRAQKISKFAGEHGMRAAALKFGLNFKPSGAFSPEERSQDDSIYPSDPALSTQVQQAARKIARLGEATVVSFTPERDPQFAVVVLDDRYMSPVGSIDEKVQRERIRANEERRVSIKEKLREATLTGAGIEEILKKAKEPEPATPQ
jgi:hypothetical protein